jgi:hypothetical protein
MVWMFAVAMAGYGDASEGLPTPETRLLHLWSNTVRVEPGAFVSDYGKGGCTLASFSATEKSPQRPLAYNHDLTDAAEFHSADMARRNFVGHNSSDGTSFGNRLARYYVGDAIGENVAGGFASAYDAVFQGWMCSDGHRENLMSPTWDELGVGQTGRYYTQDFGRRGLRVPAMTMGAHDPPQPGTVATFHVDVTDTLSASTVLLMLDGLPYEMTLSWGTDRMGVWSRRVQFEEGCHIYWFQSQTGNGTYRFPEDGAYGFGDCEFDDAGAQWVGAMNVPPNTGGAVNEAEDPADAADDAGGYWPGDTAAPPPAPATGCAQSGAVAGWGAVAMLIAARRRARQS